MIHGLVHSLSSTLAQFPWHNLVGMNKESQEPLHCLACVDVCCGYDITLHTGSLPYHAALCSATVC